jgi:hypothetical protein
MAPKKYYAVEKLSKDFIHCGDGRDQENTMTLDAAAAPSREGAAAHQGGKIQCGACPVLCQISPGRAGACDRYANADGRLVRVDPLVVMRQVVEARGAVVPYSAPSAAGEEAEAALIASERAFVTGVGSGTTYPDYKPAPFIVANAVGGVDMVTVVTEGLFSYCSMKIKVDTDRWLGPEQANVRCQGEIVGHVTTAEYGSQMLSVGGVHHLTGGSKKEGRVTCETMLALGNRESVELAIEGGATVVIKAGEAPVVNGALEHKMRVGCGSATIGIFAQQWFGHVDEVVVVDDHITGVLSEHQAGRFLGMPRSGIRVAGRKSTPGRYFQVARPGTGWGGTDLTDPLAIVQGFDAEHGRPGLRLLMVSTTGEHAAYFELDEALRPVPAPMPEPLARTVARIGDNCEPAVATVLFLAGAGGSLRAGVTENPILLTRSIKDLLVNVTCGGAPAYVWPGGGITIMVDVCRMPERSFGYVPTPAIAAPIEFTMRRGDYVALGGHVASIRNAAEVFAAERIRYADWDGGNPWPVNRPPMLG